MQKKIILSKLDRLGTDYIGWGRLSADVSVMCSAYLYHKSLPLCFWGGGGGGGGGGAIACQVVKRPLKGCVLLSTEYKKKPAYGSWS